MLNALRMLEPDASHTVLISFSPNRGAKFQETLEIQTPTSTLHVLVKGNGISPLINLSVEGGCYEFGAVIAGEYREESFKVRTERTAVVHVAAVSHVFIYISLADLQHVGAVGRVLHQDGQPVTAAVLESARNALLHQTKACQVFDRCVTYAQECPVATQTWTA